MPGGKQKQAHRTKGNVRPSSSGRAAELLASSGGSALGFTGFQALSGDLGYVPATATEDTDFNVDGDFRMVLRKLSKRDTTTKLKAIQEFGALCKEKDVDIVKGVLPYWPRMYNKMSQDYDRRVREATHQAFEMLVQKMQRELAPYLKNIMGCWLLSQYDVYAPAASAAKQAFLKAFPTGKQKEALLFCRNEILAYLEDNLLNQTKQTLSDQKTTPVEEMDSKYNRMITSSLHALGKLVSEISPETQLDGVLNILSSNKFWKHCRSQDSMTRGAFYSFISTLCLNQNDLAVKFGDKICPLVLYHLADADPLVCGSLWEAVLAVVSVITDCWKLVNPRKGVFPNLWALLKTGGGGSATVICPSLLPFLSKLPESVIGQGIGFYQEFFDSIKSGLSEESIISSPSSCAAIMTSFLECWRFCFIKNLTETSEDKISELHHYLITEQLIVLLEASFIDSKSVLPSSPLYPKVVDLLKFLHKQHHTAEESWKREQYGLALQIIWKGIDDICKSCMDSVFSLDKPGHTALVERLAKFLIAFREKDSQLRKIKAGGVKFDDEKVEISERQNVSASEKDSSEESYELEVQLNPVVLSILRKSARFAFDNSSVELLELTAKLSRTFASLQLFKAFYQELGNSDATQHGDEILVSLHKDILIPWLLCIEQQKDVDAFSSALLQIVFNVYSCASDETKVYMLNSICEGVSSSKIFQIFIRTMVQDGHPAALQWLKGEVLGKKMLSFTRDLCRKSLSNTCDFRNSDADWQLLVVALSVDDNAVPIMNTSAVDEILNEIKNVLPSPEHRWNSSPEELESCVLLVCRVTNNFFSHRGQPMTSSIEDLVLALFEMSADMLPLNEMLEYKIEDTWQRGVACLMEQKVDMFDENGFFFRAASFIKQNLINNCDTVARFQKLFETTLRLINTMKPSCILDDSEDAVNEEKEEDPRVETFLGQLTMSTEHGHFQGWQMWSALNGDLVFESFPEVLIQNDPQHIPHSTKAILFNAKISIVMCQDSQMNEDLNKEVIFSTGQHLACCSASMGCQSELIQDSEIYKMCKLLEECFVALLEQSHQQDVLSLAVTRSVSNGYMDALCLQRILKTLPNDKLQATNLLDMAGGVDKFTDLTEAKLNTLLIILPYATPQDIETLLQITAANILCCEEEDVLKINGGLGRLTILCETVKLALDDPAYVDATTQIVLGIMNELLVWRDKYDSIFDLSSSPGLSWPVINLNVQVMRYLQAVVSLIPLTLNAKHWDYINCSVAAWIQFCHDNKGDFENQSQYTLLFCEACNTLSVVAKCMQSGVLKQDDDVPNDLLAEWEEFFSEGIYTVLLPLFIEMAEKNEPSSLAHDYQLKCIGQAVSLCPLKQLKSHQLPPKLKADDTSNLPDEMQTVLNHFCPLLLAKNRAVQLTVYRLLVCLMPVLSSFDEGKDKDTDKDEVTRSPPLALMDVLESTEHGMEHILAEIPLGENLPIEPYMEEYTVTMAYLLSWRLLLIFFKNARLELRVEYAAYLRDTNQVDNLMRNVFRLMPQTATVHLSDSLTTQPPLYRLSSTKNMFGEEPLLEVKGHGSPVELQHLVCSVYYTALQDLPAAIRQWWNSQDKKTVITVEKFTSKYVSPVLCSQEIQAVQNENVKFENMTVKARPAAREVVAMYTVEDFSMELVIQIPVNYPLGQITVECGKRIGVANTQWRNWMLQMTTFLSHQNGSIISGLSLWKRNVDKRFEGVEECMICFSVIHGSNCQLPKLQCKTCKKKFHNSCLYKWFSTSNNSTCPLCRNLF